MPSKGMAGSVGSVPYAIMTIEVMTPFRGLTVNELRLITLDYVLRKGTQRLLMMHDRLRIFDRETTDRKR